LLLIVATCAIGCASASGASPDEQVVLALRGQAQEAAQWCWAAGSQSVMHFLAPELGAEVCQCRQAEDRAPGTRCCASPDSCAPAQPLSADCRDLGWPDLRRYGFDFETTCDPLPQSRWESCRGGPLGWEALVAELRSGRPVLRAYRRGQEADSGVGHLVVIFGYRTAFRGREERRFVLVFDPRRVCRETCSQLDQPCCHADARWTPYDESLAGPDYSHWVDIFGIRKSRMRAERVTSRRQDRPR